MKLSQWAKNQGLTYATAYNWFKAGRIPNSVQYDNGTILINSQVPKTTLDEKVVIYCRVSNQSRKKELEYQVLRCEEFCRAKGLPVSKIFKEVASGMNDKRREFMKMLDYNPTAIVVEHKDRLTRFGFNYIDYFLNKLNCKLIVINLDKEDETDLIKDLVSIITSFCCRLYGLRRGNNKAKLLKKVLNES